MPRIGMYLQQFFVELFCVCVRDWPQTFARRELRLQEERLRREMEPGRNEVEGLKGGLKEGLRGA